MLAVHPLFIEHIYLTLPSFDQIRNRREVPWVLTAGGPARVSSSGAVASGGCSAVGTGGCRRSGRERTSCTPSPAGAALWVVEVLSVVMARAA